MPYKIETFQNFTKKSFLLYSRLWYKCQILELTCLRHQNRPQFIYIIMPHLFLLVAHVKPLNSAGNPNCHSDSLCKKVLKPALKSSGPLATSKASCTPYRDFFSDLWPGGGLHKGFSFIFSYVSLCSSSIVATKQPMRSHHNQPISLLMTWILPFPRTRHCCGNGRARQIL